MRLPSLIIAGTGRAGTTSLFRYLASHPSVCASSVKEVRFFSEWHRDSASLETYASYFSHCSADVVVRMEASPQYLYGGERLARSIRDVLPDVKLIFTLREPVSRAFTVFRALKTNEPAAFGDLSFDDFVALGLRCGQGGDGVSGTSRVGRIAGYLDEGRYVSYLAGYISVFPREQVLVLFFDDLSRDARAYMRRVAEFLSIDAGFYDSYSFSIENRTRSYRFPRLHRLAHGINLKAERLLNRAPMVRRSIRDLYNFVNERPDDTRVSAMTQSQLRSFYDAHNNDLCRLLREVMGYTVLPEWLTSAGRESARRSGLDGPRMRDPDQEAVR